MGYTLVRLKSRHPLSTARTWLPAASFGETGCASGALAVCVAVRALERGYAGARQVAMDLSSEDGARLSVSRHLSRHGHHHGKEEAQA